ncbi:hypothetical protein LN650_13155 [Klebsiella pneumoniae subsp. pneumoniae]|nr:hypothetical protein [Klebsiella pneumoniae subsp. pneumoniae]
METVDSKVLNLAREDIVWHSVSERSPTYRIKRCSGSISSEFAGDDAGAD